MGFTTSWPFSFCTWRIFYAFSKIEILFYKSFLPDPGSLDLIGSSSTLCFISDNFLWITRYSVWPPSMEILCMGLAYRIVIACSLSSLMSLCILSLSLLYTCGWFCFKGDSLIFVKLDIAVLACCLTLSTLERFRSLSGLVTEVGNGSAWMSCGLGVGSPSSSSGSG